MSSPRDKPPQVPPPRKTVEDLLALKGDRRFELIEGALVEKAAPTGEHGHAQGVALAALIPPFMRRGGGGRPGGWWIMGEVDVRLGDDVFRPDLVGWRRDRVPARPTGTPITARPDWVAEVLSPSNSSNDTVLKLRRYYQAGIPYYWIIDPELRTVLVYCAADAGYAVVRSAEAGEVVRLEPFDAIELRIGLLFGEDPDDVPEPAENP